VRVYVLHACAHKRAIVNLCVCVCVCGVHIFLVYTLVFVCVCVCVCAYTKHISVRNVSTVHFRYHPG